MYNLSENEFIYDLRTNNKSYTGFTDIFYNDYLEEDDKFGFWDIFNFRWEEYVFHRRYRIFQYITTESFPGFTIAPIKVDVMFQIVTINERK